MTMYEPENLARYLTNATGDAWTVMPLPKPIYGQVTAAYASNATTSMWAVVVDVPIFGRSLHVVANLSGEQHTCTIELRGHSIHDTICRAAAILRHHIHEVQRRARDCDFDLLLADKVRKAYDQGLADGKTKGYDMGYDAGWDDGYSSARKFWKPED